MDGDEPKLKLIPRVRIDFLDGDRKLFENIELDLTPLGAFIIEKDKPHITRIFPYTAIKEIEIPVRIKKTKIVGVQGQRFVGR